MDVKHKINNKTVQLYSVFNCIQKMQSMFARQWKDVERQMALLLYAIGFISHSPFVVHHKVSGSYDSRLV